MTMLNGRLRPPAGPAGRQFWRARARIVGAGCPANLLYGFDVSI